MADLEGGYSIGIRILYRPDDPVEFREHETSGIKRQRLFAPTTSIWIKKNNNNDKLRSARIHIVMLYN